MGGYQKYLFFIFIKVTGILCTIDHLELMMPRYAVRGGDIVLKCEHSVPPEQLYKVEWRKGDNKIFQYIKGRKPPFRYFTTTGATLNTTASNGKQIVLSNLEFAASGSYSCTVSMDTPIFTQDSESKALTIIEKQEDNPKIEFNKETYEIGEVLKANCTTAVSKPPPHITWWINDEKVPDQLTKSFASAPIHGHGYFDRKGFSIKQLSIEVSDLHVGEDNTIKLTCMATIPNFSINLESYADKRLSTVEIDVELTEGPVEAVSNNNVLSSSWRRSYNLFLLLPIILTTFRM